MVTNLCKRECYNRWGLMSVNNNNRVVFNQDVVKHVYIQTFNRTYLFVVGVHASVTKCLYF